MATHILHLMICMVIHTHIVMGQDVMFSNSVEMSDINSEIKNKEHLNVLQDIISPKVYLDLQEETTIHTPVVTRMDLMFLSSVETSNINREIETKEYLDVFQQEMMSSKVYLYLQEAKKRKSNSILDLELARYNGHNHTAERLSNGTSTFGIFTLQLTETRCACLCWTSSNITCLDFTNDTYSYTTTDHNNSIKAQLAITLTGCLFMILRLQSYILYFLERISSSGYEGFIKKSVGTLSQFLDKAKYGVNEYIVKPVRERKLYLEIRLNEIVACQNKIHSLSQEIKHLHMAVKFRLIDTARHSLLLTILGIPDRLRHSGGHVKNLWRLYIGFLEQSFDIQTFEHDFGFDYMETVSNRIWDCCISNGFFSHILYLSVRFNPRRVVSFILMELVCELKFNYSNETISECSSNSPGNQHFTIRYTIDYISPYKQKNKTLHAHDINASYINESLVIVVILGYIPVIVVILGYIHRRNVKSFYLWKSLIKNNHNISIKIKKNKRKYRPIKVGCKVCWVRLDKHKSSGNLMTLISKSNILFDNKYVDAIKLITSLIYTIFKRLLVQSLTITFFNEYRYSSLKVEKQVRAENEGSLSYYKNEEKDCADDSEIRYLFHDLKKINSYFWLGSNIILYPVQSLDTYFREVIRSGTEDIHSMKYEWIRLKTFNRFESNGHVSALMLAKAGFFFTGPGDRCKCFSCELSYGNWKEEDNPFYIHQEMSRDCRFISGYDCGNVSISGTDSLTQSRREDNVGWLSGNETEILSNSSNNNSNPRPASDNRSIAEDGLNGASSLLAQDCYKSMISHVAQDCSNHPTLSSTSANAGTPHQIDNINATAFSNPPIQSSASRNQSNRLPSTRSATQQTTSCSGNNTRQSERDRHNGNNNAPNRPNFDSLGINFDQPKYPSYAVLTVRVSSFQGWQTSTGIEPLALAEAGFFYAGYADYCRCFFCGGGLRNWEHGDDPWVEHTRWFPKCAFILQNKGAPFVSLVLQRQAEIENTISEANGSETFSAAEHNTIATATSNNDQVKHCIETVNGLGYSQEIIDEAIELLHQRGQANFDSIILLETVFELEEQRPETSGINQEQRHDELNEMRFHSERESTNIDKVSKELEYVQINAETEALIKENIDLHTQKLCRICGAENAAVAFLPCGHLVCCNDCAPALVRCCVCQEGIKGTVKTWIA